MRIVHHKPAARGVSQLMYVGDAEAPSAAIAPVTWAIAAVLAWFLLRR